MCVLLCLVPPDSAALSEIVEDTEATLYLSKGRESVTGFLDRERERRYNRLHRFL